MSDIETEIRNNVSAELRFVLALLKTRNASEAIVGMLTNQLLPNKNHWPALSENHRHAVIRFVADNVTVEEAWLLLGRLTERGVEYVDFSPNAYLGIGCD